MGQVLSASEVATVKEFLTRIDSRWAEMTDGVKNTFLSLLLERIDIEHDEATISARVTWRTGLSQYMVIERPFVDTRELWTPEQDTILREHYPKTSQTELCGLLSGRRWGAIRKRAGQFHLQRPIEARTITSSQTPYTVVEDQVIRDFHAFKITRTEMLQRLGDRSEDSIYRRGVELGFKRRKRFVKWELVPEELLEGSQGEMGDAQEIVTNDDCSKTNS
jgi:hypothetical protein